jgi:hypothetical protein
LQGYTAQAVATKEQFVIAAEVRIGGNERSDLGPLIDQARTQLDAAGITAQPGLVLADARLLERPTHQRAGRARHPRPGPTGRRHPQPTQPAQTRRAL